MTHSLWAGPWGAGGPDVTGATSLNATRHPLLRDHIPGSCMLPLENKLLPGSSAASSLQLPAWGLQGWGGVGQPCLGSGAETGQLVARTVLVQAQGAYSVGCPDLPGSGGW